MTALAQQIIEKYQWSAPQRIISAVENAAARTGANFSQLMENAATESGFNASAKSTSSSATGLFQFIDSTWLGMVKKYGAKFGLGQYAAQITMKNGKPCVANCAVKSAILNLRKDPNISALMAGMMNNENRQYLSAHTHGPVGTTEMYLAHFLGASGAAQFLNDRAQNGGIEAAKAFPEAAAANRHVFYDAKTGAPRTLDQVYDFFAQKLTGTQFAENNNGSPAVPPAGSVTTAPALSAQEALPLSDSMPLMQSLMAQALPSSSAMMMGGGFIAGQPLSADSIYLLAQMQQGMNGMGGAGNYIF